MANFLDFEKPIAELEGKIEELRHLSDHDDFNIAEEVGRLQGKAERLLRQTYAKLTPWQKTLVARHPDRPHFKDYAARLVRISRPWPAIGSTPKTRPSSAASAASAAIPRS